MTEIEAMRENGKFELLPKKEVAKIEKEYTKLTTLLNGVREMDKLPKAVIVVDPRVEINAIREAKRLHIPTFGIVDTNCDPDDVDFPIPANDDAVRSVKVVLGVLANAVCEANGLEKIDFVSDEEAVKAPKEIKVETKVVEFNDEEEAPKAEEVVKEKPAKEVKETKEESVDYSKMTVAELRKLAKDKGISGFSTMKKDELVSSLN
jgi:small subunit ribosomal protein S2